MRKIHEKRVGGLSIHLLASVVAVTTLASGAAVAQAQGTGAAAAQSPFAELDKAKLDALIAKPGSVTFIDLRRPEEVSTLGGVPVYLSVQLADLESALAYIPRDKGIVTVSNHAGRAKAAAAILSKNGFQIVGVAGAENYQKEGGPAYGKAFVTPEIAGVVKANTRVEVIRNGFEGTEGPVVLKDGSILFTENRADRVVKIGTDNKVSTYLEKTGSANALAINASGALLAVQTAPSGVAILQPRPKVIARDYAGKPLNRPNDLAVSKAGNIYFSDPGANPAPGAPVSTPALYWTTPGGKVTLIADDIKRPNGVALSPDEKTLYVANTAGEAVIAYSVQPNGGVTNRRDFVTLNGVKDTPNGRSSGADGIAVDAQGRVYVTSNIGVQIFSSQGAPLGVIALPSQPQNLAFGGPDRSTLYVVGRGSAYRIATLTKGVDRPGK